MLKSVLLPQVIMNKTENFHKVRIGRLNLWGMFRYELEIVFHIMNPFSSPMPPIQLFLLNHYSILANDARVNTFR